MNMNLKKLITIGIFTCFIGSMGCANNTQPDTSNYLRCNETSNGKMAETEDGYFLASDRMLYYADKDNLEEWVVVCNKPDCNHRDEKCNGFLQLNTTIWQKDGRLYEIAHGTSFENPYIFEISLDGSGSKKVYEIPTGVM